MPNVCKMPGPPAPFIPTPLPNIGKSGDSPEGYSTSVKIEDQPVAIRGATFKSVGDIASKGTGGGLVSSNTHGPTKFAAPGSMDVKIEGKNVHLLSDPMLNNCGPSGSPPNSATMVGVIQAMRGGKNPLPIKCKNAPASSPVKFTPCELKQICAKCADINRQAKAGKLKRRSKAAQKRERKRGNSAAKKKCRRDGRALRTGAKTPDDLEKSFTHECQFDEWKNGGADPNFKTPTELSPDHIHEIQVGGHPTNPANLRWMSSRANEWIGGQMKHFKTSGKDKHTGVKPDCC